MQVFIYNKDFFYKKILSSSEDVINDIIKNKINYYHEMKISKKNGFRTLQCLEKDCKLSKVQQSIRTNFLNKISIPEYVHGFVPKHSYNDFLLPHTSKKFFLRLDIQNFFDAIDKSTIKEVFSYYFRLKEESSEDLLNHFIDLVTLEDTIPQGAITSPVLSNIVFRQLDLRIHKYCKKFNITYTRYADDLLFSSDNLHIHKEFFIKKIKYIISTKKFKLNSNKSKYDKDFISLNGFVIEKNIRLSRKKLKNLSSILFIIEQNPKKFDLNQAILKIQNFPPNNKIKNKEQLINYLSGYRAFIIQFLNKEDTEQIGNKKMLNYINRIQNAIIFLDSH